MTAKTIEISQSALSVNGEIAERNRAKLNDAGVVALNLMAYPFDIEMSEPWQIDMRPAIREIFNQVRRGVPATDVSARFHSTIAVATGEVCLRVRRSDGLNRVCLSGGTFQNVFSSQQERRRVALPRL